MGKIRGFIWILWLLITYCLQQVVLVGWDARGEGS